MLGFRIQDAPAKIWEWKEHTTSRDFNAYPFSPGSHSSRARPTSSAFGVDRTTSGIYRVSKPFNSVLLNVNSATLQLVLFFIRMGASGEILYNESFQASAPVPEESSMRANIYLPAYYILPSDGISMR
jgi:hypothetical protein